MKISRAWLQTYFDETLPSIEKVVDALTFHVAEVEEVEDTFLDVKILPDRAAYMLCHRGVAYELSAVLKMPLKSDPLREKLPEFPVSNELSVSVEDDSKCSRYMGAVVHDVKIGPSPDWLRNALEDIGQRSINNVVDATNYVMLNIGQPLHAFDAARLSLKDGAYAIRVRDAHAGEKITTLSGDELELTKEILVITDANTDAPIGVAGVKGGNAAEISADTTDIIIESANFDGTLVRKASQKLKLWTDASQRFQNRPSPELAAYGMRDVLKLITDIAGGEVEGMVDMYTEQAKAKPSPVSVTLSKINAVLGTDYTLAHVGNVFQSLGFSYLNEDETFTVTPPFERRDLVISEDLIEEVGRIIGYDTIASIPLPPLPPLATPANQNRFRGIERIKDFLIERGFTEISTQTFAANGDVYLANPLDQTKPALRSSLSENMRAALTRAVLVAPRVLGPVKEVKLFEIGNTFKNDDEHLSLCLGHHQLSGKHSDAVLSDVASALSEELHISIQIPAIANSAEVSLSNTNLEKLGEGYEPKKIAFGAYHPFSLYPFALRDIAVWTPVGTEEDEVEEIILKEVGELLSRIDLFDRFTKEDRTSFAFRLVFESSDRTLSDEDLNPLMERITNALNAKDGYEVR
jgi:phenylalanyl-tRNA synthetase beta chain